MLAKAFLLFLPMSAPSLVAPPSFRARATPRTSVMKASAAPKRIAILGASGYTGAELCRLLLNHPHVSLDAMTSERYAGKSMASVFPQFVAAGSALPTLTTLEDVDWTGIDLAFACLPHATTQAVVAKVPESVRVVDLSADFRLRDLATYEQWYGGAHQAPELQEGAVYGLTELARDAVRSARLVANPGCYPTAAQLSLVPLLEAGKILSSDIIIDAKSGATGAGRAPKEMTLFCEIADGILAYGVASHRHAPEIEQGLTDAAGSPVLINFTPHLMPMSRGIFESIYVKLADGQTAADLRATLSERYASERFVTVLEDATVPQTRHVRGSNHCIISVTDDRIPGRAIITAVIDNLVKGASGQAIQNMNVMLGFPEATAIESVGTFP
jgi:N-acetyl-gamma-glutamyl-phosphate reductase